MTEVKPLRIVVGGDDGITQSQLSSFYTDTFPAGFDYKAALTADLKANPLVASVADVGKHPQSSGTTIPS